MKKLSENKKIFIHPKGLPQFYILVVIFFRLGFSVVRLGGRLRILAQKYLEIWQMRKSYQYKMVSIQIFKKRNTVKFVGGLSLIEVIISIAISAILLAIVSSAFSTLSNSKSLEKDVTNVLSYIERARIQTLNGSNFSVYGVKFASSSVTVFPGTTYASSNASNTVYALGKGTIIGSVNLSNSTTTFYFQKLTGRPTATGTINFIYNNSSTTKSIIINGAGLAETI